MAKYLFGLWLLFYAGLLSADQDSDFIAARKAFQVGNAKLLAVHAERLQNHALAPYVHYYQLRLHLTTASPETIRRFLSQYRNSLMAERLREDWLKILAKNQQWALFAEEYPMLVNQHTELLCYAFQQRHHTGQREALHEARQLWFNAHSLPNSCTPLFDILITNGLVTAEDIWTRIRMALEVGQTGIAKHASRHLSGSQTLETAKLDAAAKDPRRYLEEQHNRIRTRSDREIALFAILRLLQNDTNQAFAHWYQIQTQFTAIDQSYLLGRFAYRAALRHDSRALDWFTDAASTNPSYPLTDTLLAWKVRAALRAGNWGMVLESIENMSDSEQQIDTWRYWKARILKEQGKILDANAILIPLSHEHDFYGQLAREALGTMLSAPEKPYQVSAQEIASIQQIPGIQRTMAFHRLNLRTEASREWAWTIRDFSDAQLLAAAEVAHRYGMYDRAINTANRTLSQHNFNLRFLAPHRDTLKRILQQEELDEAWVYGLIRQESRFIADSKSSAGAMGLMQLMPATAKWVAKQLGIHDYRDSLAMEINTNLRLGTFYLKHVLTLFDNQTLLASAAYNAGPGRAKRWRDTDSSLEGAIYAETIPFNETRDYVKKVLNNTVHYAKVFNHDHNTPTLTQRLGIVSAK